MNKMKAKELLSKEEFDDYQTQWSLLNKKYKYKPESEYNTHSGMPVIGKVFQFQNKPLFRTHVFQRKLRGFNPYFTTPNYSNPFWHALHYTLATEQLYHAATGLIRNNYKLHVKEVPETACWRRPIFWREPISIELIIENLQGKFDERVNFAFYNDKKKRVISTMSYLTSIGTRAYIQELERLKQGDEKALERLIRKIQRQQENLDRLIISRKNLRMSSQELIEKLRSGEIPEQELHDFFSLWDRE